MNHRLSLERIARAATVIDPVFLDSPQYRAEPLEGLLGCRLVVKVGATMRPAEVNGQPGATPLDVPRRRKSVLREYVEAIAAAAEERPDLAVAAQVVWPQVMRDVLGAFAAARQAPEDDLQENVQAQSRVRRAFERFRKKSRRHPSPPSRPRWDRALWRWDGRAMEALLPQMSYQHRHRYSELTTEPIRWPVPQQWRPEIDSWIEASNGGRAAIDALANMLRTQPIEEQAPMGIGWVERIVAKDPADSRTFLLPGWLRDVRSYCGEDELPVWQRLVDTLVIHGDTRVRDLAD